MENKRRKHFPDNNWFRQDASRNEELMEWNGVPHCSRNWIRRLGMTRLSKNFLSIYNLTDDEWPPNWMSHELGTACHELKISWTGCYRFYQHLSPIHRSLMKVWKSRKKNCFGKWRNQSLLYLAPFFMSRFASFSNLPHEFHFCVKAQHKLYDFFIVHTAFLIENFCG